MNTNVNNPWVRKNITRNKRNTLNPTNIKIQYIKIHGIQLMQNTGKNTELTVFEIYLKREKTRINDLRFNLKKLEKGEKIKSKESKRKDIIKNESTNE